MSGSRVCSVLVAGLLALGGGGVLPGLADPPAASGAVPAAKPPATTDRDVYGFFAPYAQTGSTVLKAPHKFKPFYLESVGRHGSRTTSSSKSVKSVRKMCTAAGSSGQLTSLGSRFCVDIEQLATAMSDTGYGDLTPLGEQQWEDIGQRIADDHDDFFAAAAKAKAPIRFVSSSATRAKDSSDAFRAGLKSATPKLKLKKRTKNEKLLHYSTPSTPQGKAEIDRIEQSAATTKAATNALRRLFGKQFTDLGDARDVWDLYAVAPGVGLDLDAYLTEADATQLAYLDDAETFYRYGPSVEGTHAFDSASKLRDDLIKVIDDHLDGDSTMATFRHGHAETLAPLVALLRLGPTSRQVAPDAPFTSEGWRGDTDAKMAANIDLAAYKKGSTVLVTVRYNEEPVKINNCQASKYSSYFYDLDTLRTCWA